MGMKAVAGVRPPLNGAVLLMALLAVALALPAPARAYTFNAPYVAANGPEQVVFDHSQADNPNTLKDACEPNEIPDLPARAFRDKTGRVQLIASHATTRRMVGTSLGNVSPSKYSDGCKAVMTSTADSNPSHFNDREWIAAPYVMPDGTIYSLVHMEYQGWNQGGSYPYCPYSDTSNGEEHFRCWYNAITWAKSSTNGDSYSQADFPPPANLVASIPYRYEPGQGLEGMFSPSNIIKHTDGFYYSLVWSANPGSTKRGICVMRTSNLASPSSWRAWNGSSFTTTFVNPYQGASEPAAPDCRLIPQELIGIQPQSLTWSTYLNAYLLVGNSVMDVQDPGFYYSTSSDLVHWSQRRLLMRGQMLWTYQCPMGTADHPIRDASLIDPSSTSPNFNTAGQTAYLYFTRFNYEHWNGQCWLGLDRDLMRIPIEFFPDAKNLAPPLPSEPPPTTGGSGAIAAPGAAPAQPAPRVAGQTTSPSTSRACRLAKRRITRLQRSLRGMKHRLARARTSGQKRRYRRLVHRRARQLRSAKRAARVSCRAPR
jgi:hypothetical protein